MSKGRGLRAGALVVAVLMLAGVGWWQRDRVAGWLGGVDEPMEVSPEAAASAEAKLARLRDEGEEARLSEVELSSLLRFRSPAWAAETVHDASVALHGDTLELNGRVPVDRLPPHPELDKVRMILPDTAPVAITGQLQTLPSGRVAISIGTVRFAGIPIPQRYYPAVLERIGGGAEPGLGPTSLPLPLPPGARGARIEGDHLVLTP